MCPDAPVDGYAPNLAQLQGSPKSPLTIFGDRLSAFDFVGGRKLPFPFDKGSRL